MKFPQFWYESNQTWGKISSIDDLVEKLNSHLTGDNGIDTIDDFLDKSMASNYDNLNFGTRREHNKDYSLRQFLKDNNLLDGFLSIARGGKKTENFFYGEKFYSDLDELTDDIELYNEEDILALPDDYSLDCKYSRLEPIVTLSVDWIIEKISEDRLTEDGDELEEIGRVLSANIDFDKVNHLIPKLYYESKENFKITKVDLLEWIRA